MGLKGSVKGQAMAKGNLQAGTELWLRCKSVSKGFHEDERYVVIEVPGLEGTINIYVSTSVLKDNLVKALLLTLQENKARVLFPGDVISFVNPVAIPKESLEEIISA